MGGTFPSRDNRVPTISRFHELEPFYGEAEHARSGSLGRFPGRAATGGLPAGGNASCIRDLPEWAGGAKYDATVQCVGGGEKNGWLRSMRRRRPRKSKSAPRGAAHRLSCFKRWDRG